MRGGYVALTAAFGVAVMLGLEPAAAGTWDHAHGDATNSGFADVTTGPARTPLAVVPSMGSFAPGVGPVIGPDGTVFLGSVEGVLWAVHPDGSPYWHRALDRAGEAIMAPPVVDTDGAIYVASTFVYTDHRVKPAVKHREARLYRFTSGGGIGWAVALPDHGSTATGPDQGAVAAPLNILRQGTTATILVSAGYRHLGSYETRLIGISASGALVGDTQLGVVAGDLVGDSGLFLPFGFNPTPPKFSLLAPGVAISGGDIVATDGFHSVIHLTLDPAVGFTQTSRLDRAGLIDLLGSTVLPNGESVTNELNSYKRDDGQDAWGGGHLLFTGPLETQVADAAFSPTASPAHTADGRIVIVTAGSAGLQVLDGQTPLAFVALPEPASAAPAISRNDIFVSTETSMRSYAAASLALLAEHDWAGGGLSTPAIGPTGRIYALAGRQLYVWPAPLCVEHPSSPVCGVVVVTPSHPRR